MIKCPECRHHISSMAKSCPECGAPIDPEWAEAEARKVQKKLDDVPFTVVADGKDVEVVDESRVEDPMSEEAVEVVGEPTVDVQPATHTELDTPVPTVAPSAPATKSNSRLWLFFVVVVLGVLIGGGYYLDYRGEKQREERAYALLQDCSNPEFYNDFIIRFPKSKYIDEVRERYHEVAALQTEWQQLVAKGNREQLHIFVRQHPTSPYVKVARNRIDSLDWEETRSLNSIEAVTHYMDEHPDGYYIAHAETLRQTLERKRQEAEAASAALRDSLSQATDSLGG